MQNSEKTMRLVTSGMLIAMATVLSMITVMDLPYGGSITLFSMAPICIIGYMYGYRWGLMSGVVYGIVQGLLGATMSQAFAGLNGVSIVLMALLDYIVAFAVLGFAGMFRKLIKNDFAAIFLGTLVVGLFRLLAHFGSGYLLWGDYAEWFFTDVMNNSFGTYVLGNFSGKSLAAIYSMVYNASYMIPEIIITLIGIGALMAVKPIRKIITEK